MSLCVIPVFVVVAVRLAFDERTIRTEVEFAVLLAVLTVVLIQITGNIRSPLFPLIYFTVSVLAVTTRATVSTVGVVILLCGLVIPEYGIIVRPPWMTIMLGRYGAAIFCFVFFLFYHHVEERRKRETFGRIKRFEDDLTSIKDKAVKEPVGLSEEEIDRQAVKTLASIDDLLYELLQMSRSTLGLNTIAYLVYASDGKSLRIREASTDDDNFDFESRVDLEIFREAMRRGTPMTFRRGLSGYGIEPGYYRKGPSGINSLAVVPIRGEGDTSGALVADRRGDIFLTERDIPFLELTALALKNLEEQRIDMSRLSVSIKELEHLFSVSQELSRVKRIEQVFDVVGAAVEDLVATRLMAFTLLYGEESFIADARGDGAQKLRKKRFENMHSLVGWVIENKQYLVFPDRQRQRDVFGKGISLTNEGALTIFPLVTEGEILGTYIHISKSYIPPSRFHLRLIEVMVNMAAVTLMNVRLINRLNRMAVTDPMTGLFNRRRFNRALQDEIDRAQRFAEPMTLLMLDIDKFKSINDTYGHAAGDEVIKGLAKVLRGVTRSVDVVSRIGGEEFSVILPKTAMREGVQVAEKIRKETEKYRFDLGKTKRTVTISLGISVFPQDGTEAEALIRCADDNLYRAKEGGRNQCVASR
ncbi:MAG: diguanylate cyclase [Deltaproteobacteria bacterium]|nr:diguanylate cyclase [Candidatus Zymogenaceae bacterium]